MLKQDSSITTNPKQQLLDRLAAAREDLWHILDGFEDTREIYPGWRKREFFAHMAGWEAMVFEVLRCHLANCEPRNYGYTGVDNANARFVAVRQSTTLQDAKLECEINRFAIVVLLEQIEDFNEVLQLPWGGETVTQFLEGAIDHERSHAEDILKLDN